MAQNKQPETETPESDTAQATGNIQNAETAGGNNTAPAKPPAPTPGATADLQGKTGEKTRQTAQKTNKADDDDGDTSRRRGNGGTANSKPRNDDDDQPSRRDRQTAQGRDQDDEPRYRQAPRDEDFDRPSARRDTAQRSLFGDPDDTYYDRRPHPQDRDADYDRGRRAAQGYGHTSARGSDERLSREYDSDYRRYSGTGYDERTPYQSRDRDFDRSPYGDHDRFYSEGGQYRQRPQGYRPNDNGRDFEHEAREQPRNRWRESNVDPRYDDAYDQHRNRAWSSQGNQDRHRDWDRDDRGGYSNARQHDEDRYRGQDRGYGDRPGNYPPAREDDRGNTNRWRDERRDYRETLTDDRYEDDRGPWRRR